MYRKRRKVNFTDNNDRKFFMYLGIVVLLMHIAVMYVAVPFALMFVASLFGVIIGFFNALLITLAFYVMIRVVKNL